MHIVTKTYDLWFRFSELLSQHNQAIKITMARNQTTEWFFGVIGQNWIFFRSQPLRRVSLGFASAWRVVALCSYQFLALFAVVVITYCNYFDLVLWFLFHYIENHSINHRLQICPRNNCLFCFSDNYFTVLIFPSMTYTIDRVFSSKEDLGKAACKRLLSSILTQKFAPCKRLVP